MVRFVTLFTIVTTAIISVIILLNYHFLTFDNIDYLRESVRDIYEVFEL